MRFISTVSAVLVATASLVQAQGTEHVVDVGRDGLAFTPNQITATPGDLISFVFHPKNHSVTQSSFNQPCTPFVDPASGSLGFDSGFVPVAAGAADFPTYTVQLTASTPIWIFCRQANHCPSGMVFAINPTANKTFDQFLANAKALASNASATATSSVPATYSSGAAGATPVSTGTTAAASASGSSSPSNSGAGSVGVSYGAAFVLTLAAVFFA